MLEDRGDVSLGKGDGFFRKRKWGTKGEFGGYERGRGAVGRAANQGWEGEEVFEALGKEGATREEFFL